MSKQEQKNYKTRDNYRIMAKLCIHSEVCYNYNKKCEGCRLQGKYYNLKVK